MQLFEKEGYHVDAMEATFSETTDFSDFDDYDDDASTSSHILREVPAALMSVQRQRPNNKMNHNNIKKSMCLALCGALAVLTYSFAASQIISYSRRTGITDASLEYKAPTVEQAPTFSKKIATNYVRNPTMAIDIVESCQHDQNCKFIMHHAYKTGGTTIEGMLFKMFNQERETSCCGQARMNKFLRLRDEYCAAKFSSHQVNHADFFNIVDHCVNQWPQEQSLPLQRAVVLTSFREPVEMIVSLIHQQCNRNLHKRTERQLAACNACNYDEYTDVWDEFVDEITGQLEAAYHISRYDSATAINLDQVQILVLETPDIDNFFAQWKPEMSLKSFNKAKNHHCDFRPAAEMFHKAARARDFYRQLVYGVDIAATNSPAN